MLSGNPIPVSGRLSSLLQSLISLYKQGIFIFSGILDFHMKNLQSLENIVPFLKL